LTQASVFICVHLWLKRLLPIAAAVVLASACGTAPKKAEQKTSPKYYSDDGPPESIPENLAQIPDAVPRDEPFHRYANRPYTVFGLTYVPVVDKQPTRERGIASWYGKKFQGKPTSSGEPYDMFAMTAAHKTLPIPSFARVTNVKTGQSVVVRINDRGPFHSDRVIDLSYAAAARIGIASAGSGLVEVERIVVSQGEPVVAAAPPPPPPPTMAAVATPIVAQEASALWLQLGAFSSAETAESFRAKISRDLPWINEPVEVSAREGLYRVRLGPYRNATEAGAIADKVRASLGFAPVLTHR
jgi:rare lipoprotein A